LKLRSKFMQNANALLPNCYTKAIKLYSVGILHCWLISQKLHCPSDCGSFDLWWHFSLSRCVDDFVARKGYLYFVKQSSCESCWQNLICNISIAHCSISIFKWHASRAFKNCCSSIIFFKFLEFSLSS
jgi:hypothetical protein